MMNYRKLAVVGFVVIMAIFSFYHLSMAGSDYDVLTTSDSGFFYGIARGIDDEDGFIETYGLSHPPEGKGVSRKNQFQPLMLVTLYRGLSSVNPGISLAKTHHFFSPFLFAIALIGIFLTGRELGGNTAGAASAVLSSSLVGSIYWTKMAAFDREISLILFGAWIFYLLVKMFKSTDRGEVLKYSVISGLIYGIFLITWTGALFIAPIVIGTIFLVILEDSILGVGLFLLGAFMIFFGTLFSVGTAIFVLIGVAATSIGLYRISINWDKVENVENEVLRSIHSNLNLIGGVICVFIVSTLIAVLAGGYKPNLWMSLSDQIFGFLGLTGGSGGGLSTPTIATEMQPPNNYFRDLDVQIYRNMSLMYVSSIFVAFGFLKAFWDSRKHDHLLIVWFIIPAAMAIDQSRFYRLFWIIWPVIAGFGAWAIFSVIKSVVSSPNILSVKWSDELSNPIAIALVASLIVLPFLFNANTYATETYPIPHGGTNPAVYHSLVDCYEWLRENSPSDSVVAVEWSYGHLLTGVANRKSVTDGAQSSGVWENRQQPPPDYVKLDLDGDGEITKADDKDGDGKWEMTGEGRRMTIQKFYSTSDENWIEDTLVEYRDNFELGIDYIVFNHGPRRVISAISGMFDRGGEQSKSVSSQGMNYIFEFENDNIILNTLFLTPMRESDGKSLGGSVLLNQKGQISNYRFNPNWEVPQLLWIFMQEDGSTVAMLGDFEGIPMVVRIQKGHEMPGYLREVYSSPQGQAAIYRTASVPAPEYPYDNELINDPTPRLKWDEILGEASYEVLIDDNPEFGSPEFIKNIEKSSFKFDSSLSDGEYFWKVRAFDKDGETQGWSSAYMFELDTRPPATPVLDTPENGSVIQDNTPRFEWSEVDEADSYTLAVDNDVNFTSPGIESGGISRHFRITSSPGLENGTYYWKVLAVDNAGNESPWSDIRIFTLGPE